MVTATQPSTTTGTTTAALRWDTVLVLLGGTFMIVLDVFIVNVAIPQLQRDLSASSAAVEWVVAGYALAYGSGQIVAGRLGDMYGRRRLFLLGIAVFTIASLVCGIAPSAGVLVATRILQGIGAALLGPAVLSTLNTQFTGVARLRALNAYGVTLGVAAVVGQLIGGLLVQADVFGLSWRACFLINVPVGVAVVALARRVVPESKAGGRQRLDLLGMMLVALTLVAIVAPLIDGRAQGWPAWAFLALGGAAVLLSLFVAHQRRLAAAGGSPVLALSLFRERAFTAGMLVALAFWAGVLSFYLMLALYLQFGRGLTALQAGLIFVAVGAGYLATSTAARHVAARLGRQVIALGALVRVLALALLAATVWWIGTGGSVLWLIPGLALDGAGMGFAIAPLATTVLSRVAPQHAGAASGALSTGIQVGGAVGVAGIGVIYFGVLAGHGYPAAFAAGLAALLVLCVIVAALVQWLPRTVWQS